MLISIVPFQKFDVGSSWNSMLLSEGVGGTSVSIARLNRTSLPAAGEIPDGYSNPKKVQSGVY
jgi:hypothetical protein